MISRKKTMHDQSNPILSINNYGKSSQYCVGNVSTSPSGSNQTADNNIMAKLNSNGSKLKIGQNWCNQLHKLEDALFYQMLLTAIDIDIWSIWSILYILSIRSIPSIWLVLTCAEWCWIVLNAADWCWLVIWSKILSNILGMHVFGPFNFHFHVGLFFCTQF